MNKNLTPRELEVLTLVASGATNAFIANVLCVSPRTVKIHITHILTKLNVTNRTAAIVAALKRNFIQIDQLVVHERDVWRNYD